MRLLAPAAIYFAIAFAAGFLLGTIRVLVLEPAVGPLAATAAELPFMLAFTWLVARAIVRRAGAGWSSRHALAVGLAAFVMLQAAELILAAIIATSDQPPLAAFFAKLAAPEGQLGLAAQGLFALFPLLALRLRQPPHAATHQP
jgi:hypothetical protein